MRLKLLCAAVLLAGPASGTPVATKASDDFCSKDNPAVARRLGGMVSLADCWKSGLPIGDYYTKWRVKMIATEPGDFFRDYEGEKRGTVARLLSGRTRSTVVALKLHVTEPSLDFSIPLMAINYEDKIGNGLSYVTTVSDSNADQPYFRLTATTMTALTLSASSTRNADTPMAARTLGAVQAALSVVAPQSTLITTFSKEASSRMSSAIDSTIASLFSEAKSETLTISKPLESWDRDSRMIVRVDLPNDVRLRKKDRLRHQHTDGTRQASDPDVVDHAQLYFEVTLACPRPSIFYATDVCPRGAAKTEAPADLLAQLKANVTAPAVLSFDLSPGKTLRQHISSRDFFLNFLRDLPQGKWTKETRNRLSAFCDAISTELRTVGFSTLDSKIGTWAIISGMGDLASIRDGAGDQNVSRTCSAARPAADWLYSPPAT